MREIKFRAWNGKAMISSELMETNSRFALVVGLQTEDFIVLPKKYPLMQFVGLYDKKEQEIYEGDIVDGHVFGRCVVKYYQNSFVLWSLHKDFSRGYVCENIEVIGNMYENMELLNEK